MPSFGHVQRTIGVGGITYRSKMEANYAAYLEFLKTRGIIRDWKYEPIEMWFTPHPPPIRKGRKMGTVWSDPKALGLTGISRGRVTYKPDFYVEEYNKAQARLEGFYVEVKGYMDARSKTVLARARRYFPAVRIEVIDSAFMAKLKRQVSGVVPGWVA